MKKINIGILGCASVAKKHSIKAFQEIENIDKIYIASRDINKGKECSKEFGIKLESSYERIINNKSIDAIYVPLPIGLHERWVIKGAMNKKHIICEKSISDNFQSVKKMVDCCKSNDVVLFENFMCDYHPQHEEIISMINKGKIGEIFTFKSYFGFPPLDKKNFRYNQNLGGGSLNDAGAYTAFMARKILGDDPVAVTCKLDIDSKTGVDIQGTAYIEFPCNKFAFIGFGFDNVYQNNYSIWGNKGVITVKIAFSIPPTRKPEIELYTNENFQEKIREINVPPANHFELIFSDFCNTIINNDTIRKKEKYDQIINHARLLESMRISARENRKVKVEEIS